MKISFSCMPKMNSYFYMHNHKVLNDKPNETESVAIKILVLYQIASKQTNIDCEIAGYKEKYYLASCEITFKGRFELQNHIKQSNDTELSKKWEIKMHNGAPKVVWKVIRIFRSYNPNSKRCLLCLNEKCKIETYKEDIL